MLSSARRRLVAVAVALVAGLALALPLADCTKGLPGGKPLRRSKQRVFIVGFDGMDPTLARKWMDEGKLPNLKALADEGAFARLGSTQPSESPTAWSSFATGVNPGKHSIYDFLVRDLATYFPDFNMIRKEPPKFLWGLIPTQKPRLLSTRGGTSFWKTASADGIRSVVLTVPVTFPPEEMHHGEMLGGLPLPDVRGTLGTFYYWATDLSSYEEGNTEFGGFLKRLLFDAGVSETVLKGPESPILKQEEAALKAKKKAGSLSDKEQARLDELATGKDINIPMTVRWTEGQGRADIEIQGHRLSLKAGDWSEWIPLTFKVNFLVRVHGMTQFHVSQADRELRIYASPVNLDPRNPPIPISKPDAFSADLAEKIGLYRTLGWAESADKPLNEGRLDEAEFLYDSDRAFDDREKIILESLKRDDWDLFVAAIETTDRISHMMWRLIDPRHPMYDAALAAKYGDSIEKVYRRADDFVGRLRQKVPRDAVFMVMSDHGFHSFRREVNLNTWLVQNGYMVVHGRRAPRRASRTSSAAASSSRGWTGRRRRPTRWASARSTSTCAGARARASSPRARSTASCRRRSGRSCCRSPTPRRASGSSRTSTSGTTSTRASTSRWRPTCRSGFLDGYRVGWQDTLGTIRRAVVENNNRKWSGDHCATATEISHGVFFCNRKIANPAPHIMDLAPSVLKLLEAEVPADYDGKTLW